MDIDVEVKARANLADAVVAADKLRAEATSLNKKAENVEAEAMEAAYKAGATVALIANAASTNRQRVYLLLASRGIRPGKEVGVTNAASHS